MTRIDKQVVIRRPMEDVLRFTEDWRNIPRYLDYIQSVKPLTESTAGLGAKLLVNLTFLGRRMSSERETVSYDANQGWTFKAPLMGVDALKHWRFEPIGESTRASFSLEYDPKPPIIAPLVDALLFRRRWGPDIRARLAESEADSRVSEPPTGQCPRVTPREEKA
jgi:uncharacterized membrane protein